MKYPLRTLFLVVLEAFCACSICVPAASAQTAPQISISVSKATVSANNSDLQTATVTIDTSSPGTIERVSLSINYLDDSGNPDRGYVSWYKKNGFVKESGRGSEFINLKNVNCSVQTLSNKLILTFAWTSLVTYDSIDNNDLAYYVVQSKKALFGGWQNHNTNFNVTSVLGKLQTVTVSKPVVVANNLDVQTATVTLNTSDPASLDQVSLLINYLDDSGNPNRGYMSWYKTSGFRKETNYGSQYINLLLDGCTTTSEAGKMLVVFRWTTLASYKAIANNDLAYYVVQLGTVLYGGWKNHNTNFNVVLKDTVSPSPPQGLISTAGTAMVNLNWTANSEYDLAGYDCYRSQTPGGPYTKLNATLITQTAYLDTGLANGNAYYYVLRALDTSGNASAYSAEVNATPTAPDTVPPLILELTPVNDSFVTVHGPQVSARFSDDQSGIDPSSARITFDGTDVTSQASVTVDGISFTPVNHSAEDEQHVITIDVKDRAGNAAAQAVTTFREDTTPPAGNITINNNDEFTVVDTVLVSIAVADSGSGIAGGEIMFSTDNLQWSAPEPFVSSKSITLPGADGPKNIFVRVRDNAGNWSNAISDAIILDGTPPQITITTPQDGEVINTQ